MKKWILMGTAVVVVVVLFILGRNALTNQTAGKQTEVQTTIQTEGITMAETVLETENDIQKDVETEMQDMNIIDMTDTYTRMEMCLDNHGEDIYGELYLPENADEKMPLVILTHGLGGTCEGGERYAAQFADMGIATYCYDLRYGSENSRSNNDTTKLTPFTAQSDLQTAIDASKTWNFVDADNVFLMGYSLGGLTTGITAPDNMDYIKAEIMFYPAFVIQDEIQRLAEMGDELTDTFDFAGVTLGRIVVDEAKDYDLYAQA